MIDIHNHILEGVDDGAESLEYSLEMARIAQMSGTRHIIATPHYMTGYYEVPYTVIREKVKILNKKLKEEGINIQVYPGQEVTLDGTTLSKFIKGEIGTLNETNYMLLELNESLTNKPLGWIDQLKELGVKPIIAHIERYKEIYRHKPLLNELIQRECYMQCNVNGLNGVDGKRIEKWTQELMGLGCIHLIASDAHSVGKRNPEMKSGLEALSIPEIMNQIRENAKYVLEGKNILYTTDPIPNKRGSLLRRRR